MMLLKHFFFALLLISLSAVSLRAVATADLLVSSNEYELIQKAMESFDLREHHKKTTLRLLRKLELSETCVNETNALLENEMIATYINSTDFEYLYSYNISSWCDADYNDWKQTLTGVCDVDSLTPDFQNVCETAGGQYFTINMTVSGKLLDIKTKITFKDIASCAGASCDYDALMEKEIGKLDDAKSDWEADGFKVKFSGSESKSACFATGATFISALAFFFI